MVAGTCDLFEVQLPFFLDGIDTVNGVAPTGPNDQIAIDSSNIDGAQIDVLFGECSLYSDCISIADIINTALREGIVVGFDAARNQLWHFLIDGWDSATSIGATFSEDGANGHLSVTLAAGGELTYEVPTDPTALFFCARGETEAGRVVQFIRTMSDLPSLLSNFMVDTAFVGLMTSALSILNSGVKRFGC